MKTLFVILSLLMFASCGEDSNSSGSSGNDAPVASPTSPGPTTTASGQVLNIPVATLQANFAAIPLESGMSSGLEIYHVGSYFGGSSTYNKPSLSYCIRILGKEYGNCSSGSSEANIFKQMLSAGRLLKYNSGSGPSLNMQKAISYSSTYGFSYSSYTFTRSNSRYRDMLSLDSSPLETRVSTVNINFTDGSVVSGYLVEYFYGYSSFGSTSFTSIDRFIISESLPIVANPVMSFNSSGYVDGYLSNYGSKVVKSIEIPVAHTLQRNYSTGRVEITQTRGTTYNLR